MTVASFTAIALGLLGLGLVLRSQVLPPPGGKLGLSDDELYERISGESVFGTDVLGTLTFEEAVNQDPRRIEAMVLQRIVQPLMLAIGRMASPGAEMDDILFATRVGYLRMLHQRRMRHGDITADVIADSLVESWHTASEVLANAQSNPRFAPLAATIGGIVIANMQDISRAFRECDSLLERAGNVAVSEEETRAWGRVRAILSSMQSALYELLGAARSESEVVDADIGFEVFDADDLFGAYVLDEHLEEGRFGAFEFEEYILTGHRAPSVALSQYRRMGGRVY